MSFVNVDHRRRRHAIHRKRRRLEFRLSSCAGTLCLGVGRQCRSGYAGDRPIAIRANLETQRERVNRVARAERKWRKTGGNDAHETLAWFDTLRSGFPLLESFEQRRHERVEELSVTGRVRMFVIEVET